MIYRILLLLLLSSIQEIFFYQLYENIQSHTIIIRSTINKLEILFQSSQNHKISDNYVCIILSGRLESIISDIIL